MMFLMNFNIIILYVIFNLSLKCFLIKLSLKNSVFDEIKNENFNFKQTNKINNNNLYSKLNIENNLQYEKNNEEESISIFVDDNKFIIYKNNDSYSMLKKLINLGYTLHAFKNNNNTESKISKKSSRHKSNKNKSEIQHLKTKNKLENNSDHKKNINNQIYNNNLTNNIRFKDANYTKFNKNYNNDKLDSYNKHKNVVDNLFYKNNTFERNQTNNIDYNNTEINKYIENIKNIVKNIVKNNRYNDKFNIDYLHNFSETYKNKEFQMFINELLILKDKISELDAKILLINSNNKTILNNSITQNKNLNKLNSKYVGNLNINEDKELDTSKLNTLDFKNNIISSSISNANNTNNKSKNNISLKEIKECFSIANNLINKCGKDLKECYFLKVKEMEIDNKLEGEIIRNIVKLQSQIDNLSLIINNNTKQK